MNAVIPVILFAYARPRQLRRVLDCLRENHVPLIYAFADGAKGAAEAPAVGEVRAILRAVDWCELRLVERNVNLGLGRNVLTGVGEVAAQHDAFLVWEDDLICVPGTYDWLASLLRRYAGHPRVFSVAGWTHPKVTPGDVNEAPYFDGRAECWVWGAYARSWRGMDRPLAHKLQALQTQGINLADYGRDLPAMAAECEKKNTWAVRWLCHHLEQGGLCIRPPWSLVEHIGFDNAATNAGEAIEWRNPPLQRAPVLPAEVAEPHEHPACRRLWRKATAGRLGRMLCTLRELMGHA